VTYRDVNPGEPLFISPGGINDPVLFPSQITTVSRQAQATETDVRVNR
jgi:hypothetical protein